MGQHTAGSNHQTTEVLTSPTGRAPAHTADQGAGLQAGAWVHRGGGICVAFCAV